MRCEELGSPGRIDDILRRCSRSDQQDREHQPHQLYYATLPLKWRYTNTEYRSASAIPGIHQTSPMYKPYSGAAALVAVSPASGELMEGSTYGKTPNAALVSMPIRYKHELKNAPRSRAHPLQTRIPTRPAIASNGNTIPQT